MPSPPLSEPTRAIAQASQQRYFPSRNQGGASQDFHPLLEASFQRPEAHLTRGVGPVHTKPRFDPTTGARVVTFGRGAHAQIPGEA